MANYKAGAIASGSLFVFFLFVLLGAVLAFQNAWTSLPAVVTMSTAGGASFICLILLIVFIILNSRPKGTSITDFGSGSGSGSGGIYTPITIPAAPVVITPSVPAAPYVSNKVTGIPSAAQIEALYSSSPVIATTAANVQALAQSLPAANKQKLAQGAAGVVLNTASAAQSLAPSDLAALASISNGAPTSLRTILSSASATPATMQLGSNKELQNLQNPILMPEDPMKGAR